MQTIANRTRETEKSLEERGMISHACVAMRAHESTDETDETALLKLGRGQHGDSTAAFTSEESCGCGRVWELHDHISLQLASTCSAGDSSPPVPARASYHATTAGWLPTVLLTAWMFGNGSHTVGGTP